MRKRPCSTSSSRFALVATMKRASNFWVREDPTRSNSRVSSTRSSFCCCGMGMFATSSMKRVPPVASSKRPIRFSLASVNAPLTCPKSSLSKTPSGIPPMLTEMREASARLEFWCIRFAMTPLPVPFSPVMRMLASESATLSMTSSTGFIARDWAMKPETPSLRSVRFSSRRRPDWSWTSWKRVWERTIEMRRSSSHGFCMKSFAPRCMHSTATPMLAQAVMTTTGRSGSTSRILASSSRPSCPEVVSRW